MSIKTGNDTVFVEAKPSDITDFCSRCISLPSNGEEKTGYNGKSVSVYKDEDFYEMFDVFLDDGITKIDCNGVHVDELHFVIENYLLYGTVEKCFISEQTD